MFAPRPLRNHSVSRSTEIGWYVKFQLTKTAMGYPTLTTTVRQPQIRIRRTGTAMVREMHVTPMMTMMDFQMEWDNCPMVANLNQSGRGRRWSRQPL